ncbi:hypothetical protein FD755_018913 [Muntiacus reevesi]|uniref:NADH dehydrogenase [ubiquinone] 1 beta subcomplex subunit 1 n=2 Tax=Muntiacus TaxID=9885 RepID=A0A5N3X6Y9_MUNRE|nr:hypothetical protein FD754_014531 [Muntiacus muntjak]KAB0368908.1 hypothetical protein FD755_018913 [Muntiacus reevesi]
MMNLLQIICDHWVHSHVPVGLAFGCYLDRKNDGRKLRSNEEVTWM